MIFERNKIRAHLGIEFCKFWDKLNLGLTELYEWTVLLPEKELPGCFMIKLSHITCIQRKIYIADCFQKSDFLVHKNIEGVLQSYAVDIIIITRSVKLISCTRPISDGENLNYNWFSFLNSRVKRCPYWKYNQNVT